MTLLQLKYIDAVVNSGSINRAAKQLFVAQSGISIAIRELEGELGIEIFSRTNKGVELTQDGRRFYESIVQMLELERKIEARYAKRESAPSGRLHVSAQHYPFVAQAFVAVLNSLPDNRFELQLNEESSAHAIIEAVAAGSSDIGVLFISNLIEGALERLFVKHELEFTELKHVKPHAFVGKTHALAQKREIDIGELEPYPYAVFARGAAGDGFGEEVALERFEPPDRIISTNDRHTMYGILANTDAFSIGSGLLTPGYSDDAITAIPIASPSDTVRLGYVKRRSPALGPLAAVFIEQLKRSLAQFE